MKPVSKHHQSSRNITTKQRAHTHNQPTLHHCNWNQTYKLGHTKRCWNHRYHATEYYNPPGIVRYFVKTTNTKEGERKSKQRSTHGTTPRPNSLIGATKTTHTYTHIHTRYISCEEEKGQTARLTCSMHASGTANHRRARTYIDSV